MASFTIEDLVEYVRRGAGEDEGSLDLDGPKAEITFADLGYDSIAIMEVLLLIERDLGIKLPEEMDKSMTPAHYVKVVNELLAESVQS